MTCPTPEPKRASAALLRGRLLGRAKLPRRGDGDPTDLGSELSRVDERAGLGPEEGGEFEEALFGPEGQHADNVADVLARVEPVELGGR